MSKALTTAGSNKFGLAKPKNKAPPPKIPTATAKYVKAPEKPEAIEMSRAPLDISEPPSRKKFGCEAWVRRNWIMLVLLTFGLIGLIMAILWLFKPCPTKTIRESAPVDMVFNLDGSGSVVDASLRNLMEGSQVVVEELAGNITDLRVGVTQWASGNPRVELGITTNIAAAIDVLDPNKIFSRLPNTGTWFSTALAVCGTQLEAKPRNEKTALPVFPICFVVSDGEALDRGRDYTRADPTLNTAVVVDYCEKHGINPCNSATIADKMRSPPLNITVFGLYIGANANNKRQLCDISSCTVAECTQGTCSNFATISAANNFAGVKAQANVLAESLLGDVPADERTICIDDPFGLLFLLFFLPLGIYLFWRPLSIIKSKYIFPKSPEMLRKASMAARPPPTPEAPEGAKRFRWSIKAADAYLWDLGGGGVRPMGVNFGAVAPPSAPKMDARRESNAVLRDAFSWEPKARSDVYQIDEVQPGDIDYEYTVCLMRCCPCLRPPNYGGGSDADTSSKHVSLA